MLLVVFGLYLVVPPLGTDSHIVSGMYWGVLSAFLFAVLSLVNRSRLQQTKPLTLTFQQNLGAAHYCRVNYALWQLCRSWSIISL